MDKKKVDFWHGREGFEQLLRIEKEAINQRCCRHSQNEAALKSCPEVWTGISLSGGGIRSASFCLGALQALARAGILSRTDYISTVSGGGYIGGGLQWLLFRDQQNGADRKSFPYGLSSNLKVDRAKGYSNLQYLRWHANYLLPGGGLDLFAAISVVIRSALISLAIWLPLIVLAFFAVQEAASTDFVESFANRHFSNGLPLPPRIICPSWTVVSSPEEIHASSDILCQPPQSSADRANTWPDRPGYISVVYASALALAALGCFLLFILSMAIAFVSITKFPVVVTLWTTAGAIIYAIIGLAILAFEAALLIAIHSTNGLTPVPIDVVTFVVAVVFTPIGMVALLPGINLIGLWLLDDKYRNADYWMRRLFERVGGKLLRWTLYAFAFGSIPLTYSYLRQVPISSGGISAMAGLASATLGYLTQSRRLQFGFLGNFLIATLAVVFLYALLLLAYGASSLLFSPTHVQDQYNLHLIAAAIVVMSIIFGVASNVNTTGLHRFYRDRLMELFMPSRASTLEGRSTSSFTADRLSVATVWAGRADKKICLYPIINCNAILINDPNATLASRGGANFAITPLHIGSEPHGWESIASYERKNRELSLATAVAASGAAANTNSGYVGTGVTRNWAVSLVMMLFNIRLGVWIRRPSSSSLVNWLKPTPFFPSLLYGPLSLGYRAKNNFIEISDGGHFENLGMYELVRRRIDLIISLDGEADSGTALPALFSLSRRIAEDFGARIELDSSIDEIMPSTPQTARYPNEAKFAKLPCVKATIRYDDDPKKTTNLIYIKASLIDEAPFAARGYRAGHPDYPNESTTNQFYSPEQFDAYRELGHACAKKAIGLHLTSIFGILQSREQRLCPQDNGEALSSTGSIKR